jgi:meso-butanediol dehydrogenase/(S,S)-butanediol dehydrogenase/diacetyl reductase
MYDLGGKVALVTGAGAERGLGRAIAVRLARDGADVVVNDVRLHPPGSDGWRGLSSLVQEIQLLGRGCLSVVADVSAAHEVEGMVRQALDRFGRIDILVNNAAAPAGRDRVPVVDLDEDSWDLVQRVNVKGTFLCCRAVARTMIERGQGGKIINISSLLGKQGRARYAAYSASKFAVRGFTQALALELAPHGINVNAICPGLIDTDRLDDIAAALRPEGISAQDFREQLLRQRISSIPLGRIGDVSDVASVAAFLASSESDYLTGLAIPVAGGSYVE